MKIPEWMRQVLLRVVWRVMERRRPDFVLPDYMFRWHLLRTRWGCLYVHWIVGDDDDRALHDHRSWTVSAMLTGSYREVFADGYRDVRHGDVVARKATTPHRLVIGDDHALTLFLTGPHRREWGFVTADGWVRHDVYLQAQR